MAILATLDADGLQKLSILKQLREQYKEAALSAKKEGDKVTTNFAEFKKNLKPYLCFDFADEEEIKSNSNKTF